ncbi:uncharacterized protein F4807DRAFT_418818 [Annulohypoxylon truncatum]|uniref:uncharacterized protein n=1 Tax=Annulohypoxylon truncatum TaxID=327061 RepID=UPI00200826BE|nr:uncharacterized protein F4807DRAFT_418818 [Annulohypoxylon truncatum]KAI1211730.1 hypothetical protein F4807DRAFT_418818 [Annulohypoxylon truncatum]
MKKYKGFIVVFSLASPITDGLAVTSEFQTCYTTKGEVSLDTFRCDNRTTGHSSCCMAGEVCWSNGVCHGKTRGIEDWLRESCTDHSWRDTACFDVLAIDLGEYAAGVRPCGGIDKSNLYCCDDGSTGIGSFACCNNESQTFHYNNITTLPTIIATIPLDDVASTSSSIVGSTSPESTSTQPTITNIASAGSGNSGSSSNSTAVGVGLGVGLPAAAAIFAGVGFMIWRTRRKQPSSEHSPQHDVSSYLEAFQDGTPRPHGVIKAQELPSDRSARELPA